MNKTLIGLIALVLIVGLFAFGTNAQQSPELTEADRLHERVIEFFYEKKFTEALPLAKRAAELREKTLGLANEKTLASLKNLASVYSEMRKTGDAVAVREKVLNAEESLFGASSTKLCDNLSKLGWAYVHNRDFNDAEKAFKRNLQIKEMIFGTESKELLPELNDLSIFSKQKRELENSIGYLKRMVAIKEKENSNSIYLAELLADCAAILRQLKNSAEADECVNRAKAIYISPANLTDSLQIAMLPSQVLQSYATAKAAPPYPLEAKQVRAQGAVEVLVETNEDGIVTSAKAMSGRNELRKGAEEAASKWRFANPVINGKTIKLRGILIFNFTIQ